MRRLEIWNQYYWKSYHRSLYNTHPSNQNPGLMAIHQWEGSNMTNLSCFHKLGSMRPSAAGPLRCRLSDRCWCFLPHHITQTHNNERYIFGIILNNHKNQAQAEAQQLLERIKSKTRELKDSQLNSSVLSPLGVSLMPQMGGMGGGGRGGPGGASFSFNMWWIMQTRP